MRLNRKTLLPQYCQDQAERSSMGQRNALCISSLSREAVTTACMITHLQTHSHVHALDGRQAVRSLGPLGYTCYQACTCGLSTSCSGWDLDSAVESGKTPLGCGFALRCFQRLSLLDVAIQRWPRQANWLTSGPAISVLSYWR